MRQCSRGVGGVLLVLLLVNVLAAAQPTDFSPGLYTEPGTGFQLPYQLSFPSHYDSSKKYPLVLFLHDSAESGTNNLSQIDGNIDSLLANTKMDEYNSFLLAPQTPTVWLSSGDEPSDAIRTTLQLLVQLEGTYSSIDRGRLYVTGMSMGGAGTWDILGRRTDRFAAGVPISGEGDVSKASLLVDQSIWAFHAADDTIVLPQRSREMIAAIRAAGGEPIYTEFARGGHGIWGRVYNEQLMYDWMFSQRINIVPEPASIILMIIGVFGMACYGMRYS